MYTSHLQRLFLVMTLAVLPAQALAKDAPLTVDVSLEPKIVELGQSFQYTINAATQNSQGIRVIKEPDFRPFSILGRSQMPQFIIRNNVSYHRTTLVYQLKTRRIGTFDIDPPVLAVGNHKTVGKKLRIKVVAKGQAPKPKALKTRNAPAYIDATFEPKRDPYVGEQLTLEYALFIDTRRMNAQPQPPTEPSLNAFWIEDLSDQISGTKSVIRQGARFLERIGLRRYALFPLKAGTVTIEPMKINLVTGGFFQRQQTVPVESDSLKLTIKPLPPGAPKGFAPGNIGQWTFLVTTDNMQGQVGRPITIRVTASGVGQASRVSLPAISSNDTFRILNSEETVKRTTKGTEVRGTKIATYSLMPLKEGSITIPPLSFVYFNPKNAEYQTNQSAPIVLKVRGGQLPPEPETRALPVERKGSTGKDLLSSLRSELREPFRGFKPSTNTGKEFSSSWIYRIALALPLLGLLILLIVPRLKNSLSRDTPKKQRKLALQQALTLLTDAKKSGDTSGYDDIVKAIKTYMTQALGVPSGSVTGGELAGKLKKLNVDDALAKQLAATLRQCNDARYATAQTDTSTIQTMADETATALKTLDKQLAQQTIIPWSALVVMALSALTLGIAPVDATAQDKQSAPAAVQSAVEAQDAQQWDAAITQWKTLHKAHPRDPYILYNLGTVALHKGDLAQARLSLELAMLYKPNAPRITKNLEVASQMVHLRTLEQVRGRAQRLGAADPFWSWNIARRLTKPMLSWSLLISVWLLFLIALAYPRVKEDSARDMVKMLAVFAVLIAVSAAGAWAWRAHIMEDVRPGVVMQADAPLREGPSELAALRKGQQPLVPGTKIAVEETRKSWVKVRLPDQSTGWLPKAVIEMIQ